MLVPTCVDVCLNLCRYVCVVIHACKYVHVHGEDRGWTQISSFLTNYPFSVCCLVGCLLFCFVFVCVRVFNWPGACQKKLGCLASESQGSACFCLPGPGIIGVYHHTKLSNLGPRVCKASI